MQYDDVDDEAGRHCEARILEVFEPFTQSCAMRVEVEDQQMVLKLFDRRFSRQVRQQMVIDDWTQEDEDSYIAFVRSGEVWELIARHKDMTTISRSFSAAQKEVFLYHCMKECYNAEKDAYERLCYHQGGQIPELVDWVKLSTASGEDADEEFDELLDIPGLLLEYVPGIRFDHINETNLPMEEWQGVVDQAFCIVHTLHANNILNKDVRPANLIVGSTVTEEYLTNPRKHNRHRVVMIDFAHCLVRDKESKAEWGEMKWKADEEAKLGEAMREVLGRDGFELEYDRSGWFDKFAPEETDSDSDAADSVAGNMTSSHCTC